MSYSSKTLLFAYKIEKELLSKYIIDFGCKEVKDSYFVGQDYDEALKYYEQSREAYLAEENEDSAGRESEKIKALQEKI